MELEPLAVEYLHSDQPEFLFLRFLYKYYTTFSWWVYWRVSWYRLIHMNDRWSIRIIMHLWKWMHLMFWVRPFIIGSFLFNFILFVFRLIVTVLAIIYWLLFLILTCFWYFLLFGAFFLVSLGLRITVEIWLVVLLNKGYWSFRLLVFYRFLWNYWILFLLGLYISWFLKDIVILEWKK